MIMEMTVSSSMGRPSEWHSTITKDGRRLKGVPMNADVALATENEHWVGEYSSDADKFNKIFEESIASFNAKQTRTDRMMGEQSSKPERQKSYYDGVVDGTFCYGSGKQKETPVQEAVWQIGNKDDNGVTDPSFDPAHWQELKAAGREADASAYALEHLNRSPYKEITKRILRRAVERIRDLDPEHLVVLRADYHADEPCGTPHVHLAYTLRATGYKTGMESRVASVKALEQMGFEKTADTEWGIVQLHERFKEIMAEEMASDAVEYGYTAIERKADSGEHRPHSDVETFRRMAREQEELDKRAQQQKNQQKHIDKRNRHLAHTIRDFMEVLTGERPDFETYTEALSAVRSAMDEYKVATEETAKQKAQDMAEAEFQKWEDALEAQKVVLSELEEIRDKLQKAIDTDTSRQRFMEAHRFKDGSTLEDAYQKSLKKRKEYTERLIDKAKDIANKYEAMKKDTDEPEYD